MAWLATVMIINTRITVVIIVTSTGVVTPPVASRRQKGRDRPNAQGDGLLLILLILLLGLFRLGVLDGRGRLSSWWRCGGRSARKDIIKLPVAKLGDPVFL